MGRLEWHRLRWCFGTIHLRTVGSLQERKGSAFGETAHNSGGSPGLCRCAGWLVISCVGARCSNVKLSWRPVGVVLGTLQRVVLTKLSFCDLKAGLVMLQKHFNGKR